MSDFDQRVLSCLRAANGQNISPTAQQISRDLGVTSDAVWAALRRLEANGSVARDTCDGRFVWNEVLVN